MARVTIKELAEACGVAASTVSRAMNDRSDVNPSTRARILETAKRLGYVPNESARNLKIENTKTIAVIIQGETSELLIKLLADLEQKLSEAGYDTYLSHVPDHKADAATVERIVSERKYVGVIFLGRYGNSGSKDAPLLSSQLARVGVPIVFCTTADFSGSPFSQSSVSVDDYAGASEVTRLLIERGHTHIAYACVGDERGRESGHAWALRYRGYRDAMETAGLLAGEALMIPAMNPPDMYSMACGYESVRAWLGEGLGDTTGIVCSCDAVATGVLRALHEAGIRVPQDVSVTGFDGLDIARYTVPSITTIEQPLDKIAQFTVRVLVAALQHEHRTTEQVWINGTLFQGESVGAPRKS